MSSPSDSPATIRVGTRASKLALAQTHLVVDTLKSFWPNESFEIIEMSTEGDRRLEVPLAEIGGKGVFTKELERGLLDSTIDIAVHSLKDMPTTIVDGLTLGAILEREDPRDALVIRSEHAALVEGCSTGLDVLNKLPAGSVVGTSALRRIAQLRRMAPHIKIVDVRGNIHTRLRKLDDDEHMYDALILAISGMKRVNLDGRSLTLLGGPDFFHAVGQGALTVECRSGDERILGLLAPLRHELTTLACVAERSLLHTLEGGCRVPIGVRTAVDLEKGEIFLHAGVWSLDGSQCVSESMSGPASDPESLGKKLARVLYDHGAKDILEVVFAEFRDFQHHAPALSQPQ